MTNAKRKTAKRDVGPSPKEIERMVAQLRRAPAALSEESVDSIEAALQGSPHGVNRRMALVALMKSGKELIDLANEDREGAVVVASLAEAAKVCHKELLELAKIIKLAEMRALIAIGERKDKDSVIREAKAGFESCPRFPAQQPEVAHV